MPQIRVLPPHLRDLIAAGEVCERPASVAKELIENALDAGAENITVWVEGGGLSLLRIVDDGCGMEKEDARLCFSRHATSKLPTDDLTGIITMGFRGEALAAISAVSRITLITRPHTTHEGTEIHCVAGEIVSEEPAGCPKGTSITVCDLFYNTPARLKFMKRDISEAGMVENVVEHAAFAHPEVSFRLFKEGREVLHTPGDGNLLSAIYCIYGRDYAARLLPFRYNYNGVHAEGYACIPTAGRGNRAMQYFSVNTRPIRSKMLSAALDEAYKNAMPVGKHAFCFLAISMPYEQVDVNVHPTKAEVKFVREKDVFDCVYFGIKSMLSSAACVGTISAAEPKAAPDAASAAEELSQPVIPGSASALSASAASSVPLTSPASDFISAPGGAPKEETDSPVSIPTLSYTYANQPVTIPLPRPSEAASSVPAPQPSALEAPSLSLSLLHDDTPYRFKCELFHTYIVAEGENDLFIIDKHAAHERLLYEALLTREGEPDSQLLLAPQVIRLARDEYATLLAAFDELEKAGFELEDFGSGSLLVRRVPLCLAGGDIASAISEAAAAIAEGKHDKRLSVRERLLYSVACRAAIKGGNINSEEELAALCARVLDFEDIRFCPHGRPCAFRITKKELEKRFGRLG